MGCTRRRRRRRRPRRTRSCARRRRRGSRSRRCRRGRRSTRSGSGRRSPRRRSSRCRCRCSCGRSGSRRSRRRLRSPGRSARTSSPSNTTSLRSTPRIVIPGRVSGTMSSPGYLPRSRRISVPGVLASIAAARVGASWGTRMVGEPWPRLISGPAGTVRGAADATPATASAIPVTTRTDVAIAAEIERWLCIERPISRVTLLIRPRRA